MWYTGKTDISDSAPIFVINITHVSCETHHRCPNYTHFRIENVSPPCYNLIIRNQERFLIRKVSKC